MQKHSSKFNSNFIYILIIIEILVVYFLGPYSGDYYNYKNLIEDVYPELDLNDLILRDPLFAIIALSLSKIGFEYNLIIFLVASFCLVLKNIIFLRYSYSIMIAIFYFCSLFWMHEIIQIRTALATTFIMISWEFYKANRLKGYFIAMFLAITSHLSAIIFILLYLFRKFNNKHLVFLFYAICIMLLIFGDYVFSLILKINLERINRYHESELSSIEIGFFSVLNFLILLQIYYYLCNKNSYTKDKLKRLLMTTPFLIIVILILGSYMPVLYIRTSQLLFLPILMLLCSHIISKSIYFKSLNMIIIIPLMIYAFPFKNFFIDLNL